MNLSPSFVTTRIEGNHMNVMNIRLIVTRSTHALPLLAALATTAVAAPAAAQWSEGPKLHAQDGSEADFFGNAVSISGDFAIVGSEQNDEAGENAGAAYVYARAGNGWSQTIKLMASDAAAGDTFGNAVSVSGDFAVVGSSMNGELGPAAGAAYVYRWDGSTWNEEAKLMASDGTAGDRFGISVSASGNRILVGAYTDDDEGDNSGSAYVFRHNGSGWVQESKLTANDAAHSAFFGFSVALDGTTALVGATGDNDNGTDAGAAYVFRHNGWGWYQQDKLLALDGDYFDGFGFSVDLSGDLAIVGAFADVVGGAFTGSAYVFRYNGVNDWPQETKLLASDLGHGDLFGQTVAVSGDVAVVGADREDDEGTDSGAVYVYRYQGNGWIQQIKLKASDVASHDNFGRAVDISGMTLVIGSWKDDDMGSESGSAYLVDGIPMLGETGADRFGRVLTRLGDLDGDGVDEVLAAAPFNDDGGNNAGKAYVLSGATGAVMRGHVGEAANDRFGSSLAHAGDADGDGTPDYAVGAPFHMSKQGAVYVFSGANGSLLFKSVGVATERFGWSISGGTDANGDGHDDLLVGAPYNGEAASKAGKAYLVSGDGGSVLTSWTGANAKDRFGWAVAFLGRASADSVDDFAISAQWDDDAAGNAGKVFVFSGADHSVLYELTGKNAGDQFGRSLALAGRVDSDNRNDLVVASPFYDKNDSANAGRIDVFSGVDGSPLWAKVGQAAGDKFGWTLAAVGDVDGDGADDVAATAPWNDTAGTNRGRVYIRSGANGGNLVIFTGEANGDLCGYGVAGAGDVDGNGLADVWIGAPHHDTGGGNAGRVYLGLSSM